MPSISLLPYNTFGIDERAQHFLEITEVSQLELLRENDFPKPWRVLGGGSNILLTGPVAGTVIHNRLAGIEITGEDDAHVFVKASAGESWQRLVEYALLRNLGGIENLALIPGTVGASPIQNIGAYGVEVKDVIASVAFYNWDSREMMQLSPSDCAFGYRDSIFKNSLSGKGIVVSVSFMLSKKPVLQISYGAIQDELNAAGIKNPTIQHVAASVIRIRKSKLPDPKVTPNAGSFFKNPTVDESVASQLQQQFPKLPVYDTIAGRKLAAGWMIEQCGWKGKSAGRAAVHDQQALVIVNTGGATGAEVLQLANNIQQSVKQTFGVMLQMEVQKW